MYANHIDDSNAVQVIALNCLYFIVCISVVSTYILLFLSPQVFCSDATLSEDGSMEMTMPWTFSMQSASDITSVWLVVALLSKITQTRTDGDLSFRLVAISCMQAFANRRN